jgi:hypothetical protein
LRDFEMNWDRAPDGVTRRGSVDGEIILGRRADLRFTVADSVLDWLDVGIFIIWCALGR